MKINAKITQEMTRSLFAILERRHPEISLGGIHTQLLTECFYEQLPFSVKMSIDREELLFGALLHDIGKICVPEAILNKPGKLEKEEMDLVKNHAEMSEKILGSIPGLQNVSKWVRFHHERLDGKGYYHLTGNKIPVEAKIIAITEAYSSIVLPSAFKPSRTHEDAIIVLKMGAGTQFDTQLVESFCKVSPLDLEEATREALRIFDQAAGFSIFDPDSSL